MGEKIKRMKRPSLRFNESEIKLALDVIEKMYRPIELMYYLSERAQEDPFVILFISAEDIDLEEILYEEKRDTDILFKIDKERHLFSIICQETKVDGAYRFAERLLNVVVDKGGTFVYCSELEVRSSKYAINEIIFKAIEIYLHAVKEKRGNIIHFSSLL